MISVLKSDDLSKKCGGRFKLTALVQRRLKELIEGARPLVDTTSRNMVEIAVQEIAEGKVEIDREKTPGMGTIDMTGRRIEETVEPKKLTF